MNTVNVCIIDDDLVYQFTAKKFLEKIKEVSNILIFSDGLEASKYFDINPSNEESLPDIIFLDIRMPVMDGWTFLKLFQNTRSGISKPISIYMVSSSPESKDKERALAFSEVTEYLVKPLTYEVLKDKIYSYLN